MSRSRPTTLREALLRNDPTARAFTTVDELGVASPLTYGHLDRCARHVAHRLLTSGNVGDRVLIASETGADFAIAFWGTMYAGMIAVPIVPPGPTRPADTIARLQTISHSAGAKQCLAAPETIAYLQRVSSDGGRQTELRWLPVPSIDDDSTHVEAPLPDVSNQPISTLLYTSGSTGMPKGTILTHERLLAQCGKILSLRERTPNTSVGIFWLPMNHMAGFGWSLASCLSADFHSLWIAPETFVRSPITWLDLISRQSRAGLDVETTVPAFALDSCSSAVSATDHPELDLRGWAHFNTTGERVRPQSWRRFCAALEGYGFAPRSFTSTYGSTEAGVISRATGARSFAVSRDSIAAGTLMPARERAVELQSVGVPVMEVVIIDPNSRERLAETQIGEIWVRVPLARGYWNLPAESASTFAARTADGDGPFCRTGDMGALYRGELYVTGRLKSLINIRGHKHHAEDLEATLECSLAWLPTNSVIAFADDDRDELFVVIASSVGSEEAESKGRAVRSVIAAEHGIRVDHVLFVADRDLPRTNPGKVARSRCRQLVQSGQLPLITRFGAATTDAAPKSVTTFTAVMAQERVMARRERRIGESIATLVANLLGEIGDHERALDRPWPELGLDSLARVRLLVELERWVGRSLPKSLLYDQPTIAAIARHLSDDHALDWRGGPPPAAALASFDEPLGAHRRRMVAAIRWFVTTVYEIHSHGVALVPTRAPYILCANHVATGDFAFVLACLPEAVGREMGFLVKQSNFEKSWTGPFLRDARVIAVDAEREPGVALELAAQALERGFSLGIQPEGGRSRSGDVQPFKPGAAHLAIRCGVPLVPVFVAGTREVWPIGRISPRLLVWRRLQRRRVDVHFGAPIQPGVEASARAETELTRQLREAVIELGAKHGAR